MTVDTALTKAQLLAELENKQADLDAANQRINELQTPTDKQVQVVEVPQTLAQVLEMCPECEARLTKFCEIHHRSPVSVVREALGQWFSPWPHWRGCPTPDSGGHR